MRLNLHHRTAAVFVSGIMVLGAAWQGRAAAGAEPAKAKPSVNVKATPVMGFSPARIVVTAEVRGGEDAQDLYCAGQEWDWGDDTRSQNSSDCDPYEAGKSEIKRRFTFEHVFETAGDYRIQFSLKQKNKLVARGSTDVKIRPGIRDNSDMR